MEQDDQDGILRHLFALSDSDIAQATAKPKLRSIRGIDSPGTQVVPGGFISSRFDIDVESSLREIRVVELS